MLDLLCNYCVPSCVIFVMDGFKNGDTLASLGMTYGGQRSGRPYDRLTHKGKVLIILGGKMAENFNIY